MSKLKPVARAARLVFVTIPAGLVGWQLNQQLFAWVRSLWGRAVQPACPHCDGGVMIRARGNNMTSVSPNAVGPSLSGWVCTSCRFAVLASNPRALSNDVAHYRRERALSVFRTLSGATRSHLVRRHRRGARILFAVAVLTFAWFVHMVVAGVPMRVALTWGAFSLMFAVLGLKRSYRAWQVASGRLFEAGAFAHWFRHERWLC
ncbi:MAG: hypothetical protein JWL65_3583 [Gammaproteobacteria bacterium]|nr:hypothetical protein [Gammaproteobacteria bacterium]